MAFLKEILKKPSKELDWDLSVPSAQRGQWDESSLIILNSVIIEVILVALLLMCI